MDRSREFNDYINAQESAFQLPPDPRVKSGKQSTLLIKKPKGNKSDWNSFTDGLKTLIKSITKMRDFLISKRRDYINLYGPLVSMSSSMTDGERDHIDYEFHVFIKKCNELLRNYRSELNTKGSTGCRQTKEHFTLVLTLIEAYLKSVCNIYTEQKAIRVKRACERQRLSRLAAAFKGSSTLTFNSSTQTAVSTFNHNSSINPPASTSFASSTQATGVGGTSAGGNVSQSKSTKTHFNRNVNTSDEYTNHYANSARHHREESRSDQPEPSTSRSGDDDNLRESSHLTPEEIQVLDKENRVLYDELNTVTDEVKSITGKVMEIARLQEIFTEKVLEQEQDLSRVNTAVISSTENVREGNDELREAIKKSAGFRVWVLFIIITLAFTVLFLDWYNP